MTVVLFAAPYFSDNARSFLGTVTALDGVQVGLVSQEPLEHLPERLRARVAAHWRVDDALDAGQLAHAAGELSARLGPIHRFLGAIEQIQEPLAEARVRLGVTGMQPAQARNFRDKSHMKALLRQAGLPCARHRLVRTPQEARDFVREVGFPVVVKPPAGAASQDTFRADDEPALLAAVRTCAASGGDVLLEEFVTGEEHSFDAFVLGGRVVFSSITRYAPTPLEVMRTPWIQWTVLLPREVNDARYDDVRAAGAETLRVLGLETGMCHLEWFRRRDGTIAISEVAARPPGAQITTLVSRAFDFDAVDAWARLVIFDRFDGPTEPRFAAGAAYLRGQGQGRVRAVHGLDVVRRELGPLVTDARVPQIGQEKAKSYEGEGFVIVRHAETAVVEEALRRIVSTVRVELAE